MSLSPRRHLSNRPHGDRTAALAGGSATQSPSGDEESARAIQETSVLMLARMAEALEGKSANAREALAQAANRLKQR